MYWLCILIISFILFQQILANISTPTIAEGEYKNSLRVDDKTQLFWMINSTTQTLEMAVRATNVSGYVALSFNYKNNSFVYFFCYTLYASIFVLMLVGMRDADCALGTFIDGNILVVDGYLRDIAQAFEDTSLGGSNNIIAYTGSFQDSILTYKFIRKLSATEEFDTNIINGTTLLAMSFGVTMTPFTVHMRTIKGIEINFFLENSTTHLSGHLPFTLFRFDLIVTAALILFNCIVGMIVTYVQILHPTWLGNIILHKKLLGYLPAIRTNLCCRFVFWCLNPLFQFLYLTPGELWIILNYLLLCGVWFGYGFGNAFTERNATVEMISPWARGFARVSVLTLSTVMLPAARYSLWYIIFGISFDRALKFHKLIGYFNFLMITVHGILMTIEFKIAVLSWNGNAYRWNLAGFISWLCFLFMFLFTFSKIRRLTFEFFLLTHYIFGIPAIVFAILHCKIVDLLPYMAISLFLCFVDLLLRFVVGFLFPTKVIAMEYNETAQVTKITFEKWKGVFIPQIGQFIYLWIHRVYPWEQHPFTISSIVETPNKWMIRCTVHVKKEGKYKFTGVIASLAQQVQQGKVKLNHILMRVEGPYGSLQCEPCNFHTIILVSGGIGITPMLSMVKVLSAQIDKAKTKKLKRIVFVWSVREEAMLQFMLSELPISTAVEYKVYWTGGKKSIEQKEGNSSIPNSTEIATTSIPIHTGRVDMNSVLSQVRETVQQEGYKYAGVYICGPEAFIRNVQQCAWKQSNFHFQFQIHTETFRL